MNGNDYIVGLDFDVKFQDFFAKADLFMQNLEVLKKFIKNKYELKEIKWRPSSRGHTHVSLIFNKPVNKIDSLIIRAIMYDDAYRIRADLKRMAENGKFDVLFDKKIRIYKGKKEEYVAGEWQSFPIKVN